MTHGTDNISYFSTWIKLLCQKYKKSAVIIVSQRSWDRPTCELHAILPSANILLSNLRMKEVWVLTYYNSTHVEIHHPFYIRKVDTYDKRAFYSEDSIIFSKESLCKRFRKNLNIDYSFRDLKEIKHKIGLESVFQKCKDTIVLGTGLGHTQVVHSLGSSIVRKGPLNQYIYYKNDTKDLLPIQNKILRSLLEQKDLEKFSFEALFVILNFLEV